MNTRKLLLVSLMSVPLLTAGCSHQNSKPISQVVPHPPAAHEAARDPVGPGPSGTYTVQPQPAEGSCHFGKSASEQPLPDPVCTPGAANPKVTADTLGSTICASGYTSSIRPPANITNREKDANAKSSVTTAPLISTAPSINSPSPV
ncbi:hypothetical protein ACQP2U_04460 [Nocardia sp. CA-084685]|uniref:hypothetical protein n=1 Tax=Nocardia sp. CA-084685 TaxID=3239970 RepID=UPI003D951940